MDLDALTKIGFSDMRLWGLRWEADGRDLVLAVELGDGTQAEVCCAWATNLRINITKGERGGPPMTWEGAIKSSSDGRHHVTFDFAGEGEVSLECNEVLVLGKP